MSSKADKTLIRWQAVRGRNGWDAPSALLDDMAAEAVNVTFRRGTLGAKRHGSSETVLTSLSGSIYAMTRFVAGQDDTLAQLILVQDNSTIKRVTGGTTVTGLTLPSVPHSTTLTLTSFANLNGKCYIALRADDGGLNRLWVYDPGTSTSIVRLAGLATPAAPTAANTGVGAYAIVSRWYKQQWRVKAGSTVQRQGQLSASVGWTPNGTSAAVRVTQAAATASPAEGETHWAVYGSADNANFFLLSEIAVGTTIYDDSADPNAYNTGTAAPLVGDFTPFPNVRFLAATANRLLGFGIQSIVTTAGSSMPPRTGRVWFSPPQDTSDTDDDERVQNSVTFKGWIDVGRNSGSEDRGIVATVDNQVLVGQSRGLHLLTATGQADQPFTHTVLSSTLGMLTHWSSFVGEDEAGNPCIYFLDPALGPYRFGLRGLEWLGYDIQDLWATIDLSPSGFVPAHGVYHQSARQCWWWLASTNGGGFPDTLLVFHVREGVPTEREGVRYGWVTFTGTNMTVAASSCMFANTFGAAMSRDLVPYFGTVATQKLIKADDSTATDDRGTGIQAYVTSKAWDLAPPHHDKSLGLSYLQAKAASGVTIRQTLIRNFSDETASGVSDRLLTASAAGETRVLVKFDDAKLSEAFTFQVKLGDSAAVSNAWTLDQWIGTIEPTNKAHG